MESKNTEIGLALSGGGFRATLFHCGTLLRLNELGFLSKLDRITSISGGSITSGVLAVKWHRLQFDNNGVATNLIPEVIEPLQAFCRQNVDWRVIGLGILPWTNSAVDKLIAVYDRHLFHDITLDKLPKFPNFIFKSTNLVTGKRVRFSQKRIADYTIGEVKDVSGVRLSQAVAASSGFPPFLSPIKITFGTDQWTPFKYSVYTDDPAYTSELSLTDGGVYDNLGVGQIDHYGTVLVSDAGAPFSDKFGFKAFSPKLVLRALDIALEQALGQRKTHLISDAENEDRKVAYWGINQNPAEKALPDSLPVNPNTTKALARIRTRLNHFKNAEQGQLINWGYAACDTAMRHYIVPDAAPPSNMPVANYPIS